MSDEIVRQHWLETYKSLISIAIEGFRYLALINGGAVVAILAYLGSSANHGGNIEGMRWPMLSFLIGLVACGAALLFGYMTQLQYLNVIGRTNSVPVSHNFLLYVSVACYVVSLSAFCIGAWCAVAAFSR